VKLNWLLIDGEYEAFYNGHWGFVHPEQSRYRAYDGRFPRNAFGTGFLGTFATLYQAALAVETAWGLHS
jgi:hypothetical protein